MGMVQGAAVAIVATVGTLAIPMMKKNGYKPEMAAAIEAVAANGGQIMPPVMGIAAFIMVDFLGVGYDRIVLAGILPAIVYYAALFFQIDFEAAKNGLKGLPRNELPSLRKTIIDGWYYLLPIAALLFFLLYFQFSASLSAMGASIVIIAVSYFKKQTRIGLNKFGEGLKTTATSMMMIAVMCATAGIIVGSVQLTGLAFRLSGLLTAIAGGNIAILLVLTAVVAIILGMGMPTSAVYVILATLVAPTMVKMGIVPMAAHFFLFYYGVIALITPPVCPASYVSAAIANSPPMKTGWLATRIGIAGFVVPFVFVFKPVMLLQGSIVSGLLVGLEATVIVLALSSGLGGYLWKPINIWQRVIITVGGFTMLYPYSSWATVTGLVFIAIPVFLQLVPVLRGRTRRDKHS
jgi:TRAP transporter 4TM/12TM fusion protein